MNNASATMIRRASELDSGSRVVVGGMLRTVVTVHDIRRSTGVSISIRLDNGCCIIERPSALYTCV